MDGGAGRLDEEDLGLVCYPPSLVQYLFRGRPCHG